VSRNIYQPFTKLLDQFKGFPVSFFKEESRRNGHGVGILILFSLVLLVAWYKMAVFGTGVAPSGSDGGQWLAFAHELFGGESVRAGFGYYPPLLPFGVKLVSFVAGPLYTLKLVGIFTSVLIAVPVYLLLSRNLAPWLAALMAITAALTPFNNEVLSFGGYPQLLGTSFLLFSIYFLLLGFDTGRRRWFLLASLAASTTIGSNILPALVLVMTSGLIVMFYFIRVRKDGKGNIFRRFRTPFLWWFTPSLILSLPFSSTYFAYLFSAESSPANPAKLTMADIAGWAGSAWRYEFLLWAGVISVIGLLVVLLGRTFFKKQGLLADASGALLLATFFGFLMVREIRFLEFGEIGLILIIGLIPRILDSVLTYLKARQYLVRLTLYLILGFVLVVGAVGHRRLVIASDWYRVVDSEVLDALDWLRDNGDPGSIVITTGAGGGHNYGWWIEGYTHHPAYMAGDPFLFFNTEERAQVELAQHILLMDTPSHEIRAMAEKNEIRFLFLDKDVLYRTYMDLYNAGFIKRFENDSILIMENTGR